MEELSPVFDFDGDINEAKEPAPLPEAEYPATVQGIEMRKNRSDRPMAVVLLRIAPSAYPPDYQDGDPDGTIIRDYISIPAEPRNWYLLKQAMQSYGVRIRRKADGGSTVDMNDLQGQDVLVTIRHREYQGRTQMSVGAVRPA